MTFVTWLRPGQRASTARIRASACRGYVVELDPEEGETPRMIKNLTGNVVHFRSLDQVRESLRRRGVCRAFMFQQHACEEVGAGGVSTRPESGIAILV